MDKSNNSGVKGLADMDKRLNKLSKRVAELEAALSKLEKVSMGKSEFGKQGWRSDESTHLPSMWSGFEFQSSHTRRHTYVEFVGSLLCSERFFSGYSGFPFPTKTNI